MSDIILRCNNLTKNYGSFVAVDDISFEVGRGRIFAFLGTNGAGKTSTIKVITGITRPTSGQVEVGGIDVLKQPLAAKKLIGFMPDRPHVYGKLTGREFVIFMAELYNLSRKKAELEADKLLDFFGLRDVAHDLVETYSHGMKQRLILCGALVHNPQLLVVDEPMVGLDPHGARLLKDTFRERARQGLTIFMSTHTLSVAEEIADQVAIIKKGKIVANGTVAELNSASGMSGLENLFLHLTADDSGR